MKNKMKFCISVLLILTVLTVGIAMAIPANDNSKADEKNPIVTIVDTERGIAKAEFIHKAKGKVPTTVQPASGTCWSTFASWYDRLPVTYRINPANRQGLDTAFITSAISTSAETWDAATGRELFNNAYVVDSRAKYGRLDGKNSIVFGRTGFGTLAVTSTWYYTSNGQIIESDMMFNDNYIWGDVQVSGNTNIMDLPNIATHEFGHVIGENDQYNGACSEVTMYGYGDYGETKKRTLETPDILGLLSLYP
jgi:hypothetical protein